MDFISVYLHNETQKSFSLKMFHTFFMVLKFYQKISVHGFWKFYPLKKKATCLQVVSVTATKLQKFNTNAGIVTSSFLKNGAKLPEVFASYLQKVN